MMMNAQILPQWGRCPAGVEGAFAASDAPSVSAARCHLPQQGRI